MRDVVKISQLEFDKDLFANFMSGTTLDMLL